MGAVVPIFPIFFLSVSGLALLDRQLVSDALHSVNSGDELNDPLHIGRTAHFAGQGDDAFFRLDADAARDRRKIRPQRRQCLVCNGGVRIFDAFGFPGGSFWSATWMYRARGYCRTLRMQQ